MTPLHQTDIGKQLIPMLAEYSDLLTSVGVKYGPPMIGATWGTGRFCMASVCGTANNGLHEITYLVVEKDSATVVGTGPTKADAIGSARDFLCRVDVTLDHFIDLIKESRIDRQAAMRASIAEQEEAARRATSEKAISRRRLKVFSKSSGHCHYCACELDLHGDWHVEHMVPVSRGGPDTMNNLVASCVTCNFTKHTQTADEFMAARAVQQAEATA